MSVRLVSHKMSSAATVLLTLFALPGLGQPVPPPPAPQPPVPPRASPPIPPRAPRVLSLGGPVSYLGIGVKEILGDRAKELKLNEEAGIEVTRVDAGSPAEQAGLKSGDAVLEYQGTRIEGAEQFVRLVRETPAGRHVKLKIVRGGAGQMLSAVVGERQSGVLGLSSGERERMGQEMDRVRERLRDLSETRMPDIPHALMGWRSGMLGIDGVAVEDQLAAFFGVNEGILVRSVAKDMPAAKAGIQAGDVIVRVAGSKVRSPRDITSAIRAAGNQNPLRVTVFRRKVELNLDVEIERERPRSSPGVTVARPNELQF